MYTEISTATTKIIIHSRLAKRKEFCKEKCEKRGFNVKLNALSTAIAMI